MPTEQALAIEEQLDVVLSGLDQLVSGERSFDPATSARWFRIAAPEFVSVTVGGPLIADILARAPNCRVQLMHLDAEEARIQLARGQIDIALGRFDHAFDARLEARPCYDDEFCVVARPGHPGPSKRLTLRAYRDLVHVFAEARSEILPVEDTSSEMPELRFMIVPRWLAALAIVAQSDMVATCPRRLAESLAATLNLKVVKLPWEVPPIRVSLLKRKVSSDLAVDWLLERLNSVVVMQRRTAHRRL